MELDALLKLFEAGATLKRLPRSGWLLRGVAAVESVADHSYGVGLIALALCHSLNALDENLDAGKVLSMAMLHDLAEARLTDLPSSAMRYISRADKHEAELAILQDLFDGLPSADQLADLWREYAEESTREGRLVRDADRLEMMVQCLRYEQSGSRGLDEFWASSDGAHWHYPLGERLYQRLRSQRPF